MDQVVWLRFLSQLTERMIIWIFERKSLRPGPNNNIPKQKLAGKVVYFEKIIQATAATTTTTRATQNYHNLILPQDGGKFLYSLN